MMRPKANPDALYSVDVAQATGIAKHRIWRFLRQNLPRVIALGAYAQGGNLAIPKEAFNAVCDLCIVADHTARRAEATRKPSASSVPRASTFKRTGRRWESVEAQQQAWMAGEIGCAYITPDGQRKRLPPKGHR
jgi:hypothetical protein